MRYVVVCFHKVGLTLNALGLEVRASLLHASRHALRARHRAFVLALVLMGTWTAASATVVTTRFGEVEVKSRKGAAPVVSHDGKTVLALPGAVGATAWKAPSQGQAEYIVVEGQRSMPACPHAYWLLEIGPERSVRTSHAFGECRQLKGVSYDVSAEPHSQLVLHLRSRGKETGGRAIEYLRWQNGRMVPLSGPYSTCVAKSDQAKESAAFIKPDRNSVRVGAGGRLVFHSGPEAACAQPALFIVPGDVAAAILSQGGFTYIAYRNPRTGREVEGWVASSRLVASPDARP